MLAYKYDKETKEYLGTQEAQINPLEGGYLLPANCTFLEVQKYSENEIPVFENDIWVIKVDNRGKWQVKLDDVTFSKVDYIGEKAGYQVISDEVYEDYLKDNDKYKVVDGVFVDVSDTEEYKEKKRQEREQDFNKAFFNTSLGYVRRAVTMADGSHKDFLSDLLPVISMGVQAGSPVNILTYDKPPFDHDIEDWTEYQHQVVVTPQFIQECFMQLSNDFLPINEEVE